MHFSTIVLPFALAATAFCAAIPTYEPPTTGNPSNGNPSIGSPSNGNPSNGNPSNGNPSNGNPSNGSPSNGNPSGGRCNGSQQAVCCDGVLGLVNVACAVGSTCSGGNAYCCDTNQAVSSNKGGKISKRVN
ncbi:hypothetical protein EJ04DRAFT_151587 [Polyplosphaeria fusca]|uniref:Hydrophobin n=1 Tax=Polyplosphaeria fusca TaxID=682080 RepID=A0A9P4QLS5_9PLEO|nr:hypothetical protein EJ04DRAFT_151587 [Polyplosphaeria fusca]